MQKTPPYFFFNFNHDFPSNAHIVLFDRRYKKLFRIH